MKIKMITLQAGPNGTRNPGEVYDVPTAEAEQLIKGGYAEKVHATEDANQGSKKSAPRTATRGHGRTAAKQQASETESDTPNAAEGEAPESNEDSEED